MRKPVFGVFDQVRHKPGCTITEDGLRLEGVRSREVVLSMWRKNKGANIPTADRDLCFCIHAKSRFSHGVAHMVYKRSIKKESMS